jgi:hypothetical protein
MMRTTKATAILRNPCGPNFPPLVLNMPASFQLCVDAGAAAAMGFFDDADGCALHDHIAFSVRAFTDAVRALVAMFGQETAVSVQGCVDAFAAGYLGRIQQELHLFHRHSFGRKPEYER